MSFNGVVLADIGIPEVEISYGGLKSGGSTRWLDLYLGSTSGAECSHAWDAKLPPLVKWEYLEYPGYCGDGMG